MHTLAIDVKTSAKKKSENEIAYIHKHVIKFKYT